jgi:serine/threonine protein kinase
VPLFSLAAYYFGKMTFRSFIHLFAMIYYVIELAVLSFKGQQFFLKVLETLMLISSCLILLRTMIGDAKDSQVILFIDSCLFGLTAGWLCFASSSVEGDTCLAVFFSLNGIFALLLTCVNVRLQQQHKTHDAMCGDTVNEYPGNGDVKTIGKAPSEDTCNTHNARYENSAPSKGAKNTHDRSVEASFETDDAVKRPHDDSIYDGFRVKLENLPMRSSNVPHDVPWESFSYIEHRVDSSSCHIYSAFWRGTAVIIKLIKADRVSSPMAVAEFETEASVLSRLEHPHIVKLLGSGRLPRRFLILELLDGGSLSHSLGLRADTNNRLAKKKFNYLETLHLARSLASSLEYLHSRWDSNIHVIHRDLKPDNIGFTAEGKLKLFDFGLCACVRTSSNRSDQYRLTGNTGTLRYMAPEVALGRQYNSSVDVYSFGVIVWQVLRSKVPFRDMGKKAYIQEVVVGGKRPALDRRWPQGFSQLLQKCWHEDKDARPTFSQVVVEIDLLILEAQGRGAVSVNMQISHKLRKAKSEVVRVFIRYRPALTALALALVVAAVTIIVLGGQVSGSSVATVSAVLLYLVGMSYVQAGAFVVNEEERKGFGLRYGVHRIIHLLGRGRRRSAVANLFELKSGHGERPMSSPAASPVACVSTEDPSVAFNPLSLHSLHHSSEGDELERYFNRAGGRDVEMGRPAALASV